jgi:YidC/Oxa1 family membrane protein insertase
MKKNNYKKLIVILLSVLLVTGCTTQLKDSENKPVKNPTTGQTLTKNILCKPDSKDEETLELYLNNLNEEEKKEFDELPLCKNFGIGDGGYEGLWASVIVKPLAWVIIQFGNLLSNYGIGLIITSLLIRLIAFPLTRKTAIQSELMKEAKPKLDKLEKKYAGKNDQQSMTMKTQEMMAIYKEYNISPFAGCLFAFIQIPLFIGFLEAINRVPAIFEETLLWQLGTTPMTGISNGNFLYILLSILVGVSTFYSLKLNSASNPDNQQMKVMTRVMFFMILFTSFFMTSALNIYWITTNLFTVVQNLIVKRKKEKV